MHQKPEAEESKSERSKDSKRSEASTKSVGSKKSRGSVRPGGSRRSKRPEKRGKTSMPMEGKVFEDSDTEKSESEKSKPAELERVKTVSHIPESEKSESPGSESEVDTE